MNDHMYIANHGGMCCGIKHIFQMGTSPNAVDSRIEQSTAKRPNTRDVSYIPAESSDNFYHLDAPSETKLERLKRYINFLSERRPSHIVEVVISESKWEHQNQIAWMPVLEELGFKKVSRAFNSNSGNTVHIYHLILLEGKVCEHD